MTCKAKSHLNHMISTITSDDLRRALANKDAKRKGRKVKHHFQNPAVRALLNCVETSSSFVWGSNSERRSHRRKAFATADRHGQPSMFLTITPNIDGTITLAYMAGDMKIETLYDGDFRHNLPSDSRLHKLAFCDNMASATLFDRTVQAFLDIVLGYDSKYGAPRRKGGLFGHVKGYYGMVETQGIIFHKSEKLIFI